MDDLTEDVPLTLAEAEAFRESLRQLNLTSCDFVGDSGCSDPDCWRCHSPMGPENLRTLAENLATAALLCWAWQLREVCPTWLPGCGSMPELLPPLLREAIALPRVRALGWRR
jgi:hypothetical protein